MIKVDLMSYDEFCQVLDERASFDQGETFKALKHSVQDKLDSNYEKIGTMTISKGDEFEVIEKMENDIIFKGKKGYMVITKREASNIFDLV
jgi:hypothetical protein